MNDLTPPTLESLAVVAAILMHGDRVLCPTEAARKSAEIFAACRRELDKPLEQSTMIDFSTAVYRMIGGENRKDRLLRRFMEKLRSHPSAAPGLTVTGKSLRSDGHGFDQSVTDEDLDEYLGRRKRQGYSSTEIETMKLKFNPGNGGGEKNKKSKKGN